VAQKKLPDSEAFFATFAVMESMIRKTEAQDLEAVNGLLRQVLAVHHKGRPDLFNAVGKKYTDDELRAVLTSDDSPVFVYEGPGGEVLGHAFCLFRTRDNLRLFTPVKTLYIDDICVDEAFRRRGIGSALYRHLLAYAKARGCYHVTLNVWACNPGALEFYASLGMKPMKTMMEQVL
jgi:ribosomal protein S18 acetylase RimI-like enzyme